jgi:hypothetical protein
MIWTWPCCPVDLLGHCERDTDRRLQLGQEPVCGQLTLGDDIDVAVRDERKRELQPWIRLVACACLITRPVLKVLWSDGWCASSPGPLAVWEHPFVTPAPSNNDEICAVNW